MLCDLRNNAGKVAVVEYPKTGLVSASIVSEGDARQKTDKR